MKSAVAAGRVAGLLLLAVFVIGVVTFQYLQAPVLVGVEGFDRVASHSGRITASTLAGLLSGSLSIGVALVLLPVFRAYSERLALAYIAFTVVNFVAITVDTVSVVSILEASRWFVGSGASTDAASDGFVPLLYERHLWTHLQHLLLSCLPVTAFFLALYVMRGVPRALAAFGVFAAVTMAAGIAAMMMGVDVPNEIMIPIALVQVVTPLWLIVRGLRPEPGRIRLGERPLVGA